jgi:hypothetical protein
MILKHIVLFGLYTVVELTKHSLPLPTRLEAEYLLLYFESCTSVIVNIHLRYTEGGIAQFWLCCEMGEEKYLDSSMLQLARLIAKY